MKNVFSIILFLIICPFLHAQDFPTDSINSIAFPIGSKFTIKLHPADSLNFDFSIIELEPFEEVVDTWENDHLFLEKDEDDTITFYFCHGTHGKTVEEKEDNMKVLLLIKNYSKKSFQYLSDIQMREDGDFEYTSNVGISPGAFALEIWPFMIYAIKLGSFRENKKEQEE